MYKLKKVYICDNCGKISLPDVNCHGIDSFKTMPENWDKIGKSHFCETCGMAFRRFLEEEKQRRAQEEFKKVVYWAEKEIARMKGK